MNFTIFFIWPNSNFFAITKLAKNQFLKFELGKSLKLPGMQIHEKYWFTWFHEFFWLDFFKFSGPLCVKKIIYIFHFQIQEATKLLNEYNGRLEQELKDRTKVGKMIRDFLHSQNNLLVRAEENLEIYRDKLDKVNAIRDDLKSHIQSLPDLTKLPDVTGGLAPLPSAGDLFMK